MMEKWNGCPAVLKRRICFTLLAGPASVIVSLIIYLAYADTVLLTMSGAIFICCLYRGKVLWDIIRREAYIVRHLYRRYAFAPEKIQKSPDYRSVWQRADSAFKWADCCADRVAILLLFPEGKPPAPGK